MKFKNDFPKNYEWILNRFNHVYFRGKDKKQTGYEFEMWDESDINTTIAHFRTKTASEMAKKINKFLTKKR